ncbi:MAG: GDSL-type esterase/lipase family protein [Acidobacteriota bacterium]|nr:GDSL-type esterase/lipase family protein [Acidobacteriota bacterium]
MTNRWTSMVGTTLVLGVLVAVSAHAQRPEPIDPARYETAIQAFEAQDQGMMPPAGAIVVTGSSSIARWNADMKADLAPLTVIPRGFGGSAMADVLHFADRIILPYEPRAVVIYEGDNDTGRFRVPPTTIARELEQIISQIHTALPDTRVYVMSVKPSLAREAVWDKAQETNELYQTLAASDERLRYIDVATPFLRADGKVMDDIFIDDGLHLNGKGTAIWATTIKAALMAGGEGAFEETND